MKAIKFQEQKRSPHTFWVGMQGGHYDAIHLFHTKPKWDEEEEEFDICDDKIFAGSCTVQEFYEMYPDAQKYLTKHGFSNDGYPNEIFVDILVQITIECVVDEWKGIYNPFFSNTLV